MNEVYQQIVDAAVEVYKHLSTGHSEAVYHKAMETELRLRGIMYSTKSPISISYKGYIVGYSEPDIIVSADDKIIVVELKATTYAPRETEKTQIKCYLRTLNTEYGILINFPQPTSSSSHELQIHIVSYGFEESKGIPIVNISN